MQTLIAADSRRLKWLRYLSLAGALFTVVVILVGAWTRLVDAGLGCPDWPGCYGAFRVPDAGTAALHSPHAPLEASKAWVEMIHRYLASSLGLLVVCLVVIGARFRRCVGYPWRLSQGLLAAILLQGAFGAFTVTLKLWPQVVTLHLLGGVGLLTLFVWLHLRLRLCPQGQAPLYRKAAGSRLGVAWWFVLGLLIAQLMLGGWTSSNYAGLACQGFPACNGQWLPALDWGEGFHLTQTVGPSYLHGSLHAEARTAIHFAHRLGALALVAALLLLWRRYRGRPERYWLTAALGACLLQACLGIANVLLWLPLWLALMHTAGAVALVICLLMAVWRRRFPESGLGGKRAREVQRGGEPWLMTS